MVRQRWVGGALIGFYANLLELNEQSKEILSNKMTVNLTNESIARRLRMMASNLSQALDGLNSDKKFPIPKDFYLNNLIMPNGKTIDKEINNIQDVLLSLVGIDIKILPK
jgi:hypothetical protein